MNVKTTYLLFGTLIAVIAIVAYALWNDQGKVDVTAFVLPKFQGKEPALKKDDVDRIEIERNEPKEDTIVLVRDSAKKQWRLEAPVTGRADNLVVNDVLRDLEHAAKTKADKPSSLAAAGLQPPQVIVTLKKTDGPTVRLNIGKEMGVGTSALLWVQDPDRPKDAMAVRKAELESVLKPLSDFRDPILLSSTSEDLVDVKLSEGAKAVQLEKQNNIWRYTLPAEYGEAEMTGNFAPSDTPRAPDSMNVLLTDITNLKLQKPAVDIVADNVKDSDLGQYNLDDKSPILHVQIKIANAEKPVELLIGIGKKADKKPDEKMDKYFAKMATEKTVVRVPANDADSLMKLLAEPGKLRSRVLVASEPPVDAVNIQNKSGLIRLRRQEGGQAPSLPGRPPRSEMESWTLWANETTSSPVDPAVMNTPVSLLKMLTQKTPPIIESFIDLAPPEKRAEQEKELELANSAVLVSLWAGADGIVKEEKKDDKTKNEKPAGSPTLKSNDPTYRISFGKHVEEAGRKLVVVKRETKRKAEEKTTGDKTTGDKATYEVLLARIPVEVYDVAIKGPLHYMNKQLPGYSPDAPPAQNVTKVLIQRPGAVWEMTRAKDSDPWTIVKPPEFANRMADPAKLNLLLTTMNWLPASELIAEKVSNSDLEKLKPYGLDAPPIKIEITVTKDDKPTTHTIAFGKEGPKDGMMDTYYAKLSWNDMVFTYAKRFVEEIPTDFQDMTVVKFDPANVKTLKLTGWEKVAGFALVIELERKDSTSWTVKNPPDYNIDPNKVKNLLADLSKMKAEKFVGKLPKADADLEVSKGALVIEITFEKDDKPLKVVVGKADSDATFLATSSRVPDDVIQVKKSLFEAAKSAPAFFSIPK